MGALFLLIGIGINIPLAFRLVAFMSPLQASPDGTNFTGRYKQWKLSCVTGRVVGSNTVTRTAVGYQQNPYSGQATPFYSSSVHDTIRLETVDGRQSDVRLLNYNVSAQTSDVISVWYANRGNKWVTVAVLNHTTRQQQLNAEDLLKVLAPHGTGMLLLSAILTPFLVLFGGGSLLFLFWAVVFGLFLWGQKRIRRSFAQSDISSLWQLSGDDAQRLMAR